jgi:hypothetical protein
MDHSADTVEVVVNDIAVEAEKPLADAAAGVHQHVAED